MNEEDYINSLLNMQGEPERYNAVIVEQTFKATLPTGIFTENEDPGEVVEGMELMSTINEALSFLKDFIEGRKVHKYKANQIYRRLDRFALMDECYTGDFIPTDPDDE